MEELTATEALRLAAPFLSEAWRRIRPDQITLKKSGVGKCNSIFFVTCEKGKELGLTPNRFVIRITGGNVWSSAASLTAYRPSSPAQEVLVAHSLSLRRLAPTLIGVMHDSGRIEEWVDCRSVTRTDIADAGMRTELAKNVARFHLTEDLPLPRPGYRFLDVLRSQWSAYQREHAGPGIHSSLLNDFLLRMDQELDWLQPLIHPDHHSVVLMHWDCNFNNILIRNDPNPQELRTILLDYEFVGYNMRGKDLGLLLLSMGGLLHPPPQTQLPEFRGTSFSLPGDDLCRSFLSDYMREVTEQRAASPHEERGKDLLDHLMFEALVGAMLTCLCYLFALMPVLHAMSTNSSAQKSHRLKEDMLLSCYLDCKSRFLMSFETIPLE